MYSEKIFNKTSQEDSYWHYYKLIFFVIWVNAFNVPLVLSVYIVVSCVWWGDVYRYVWEKGEGKPGERRRGGKEEREFYFLSNIYHALLMLIMKERGQWPILWRVKY